MIALAFDENSEAGPDLPNATAIEDLLLVAECSTPGEWENQVLYLPLR